MVDNIMSAHDSRPRAWLQNRRQHPQRRRFPSPVGAQQAVNLPGQATEAHVVYRSDFAAFLVPEMLGKVPDFDHSGPLVTCREDRVAVPKTPPHKMLLEKPTTVRRETRRQVPSRRLESRSSL